jgi:hypothetical protein
MNNAVALTQRNLSVDFDASVNVVVVVVKAAWRVSGSGVT